MSKVLAATIALAAALCTACTPQAQPPGRTPTTVAHLARPDAVACLGPEGSLRVVDALPASHARTHGLVIGEAAVELLGQRCQPEEQQLLVATGPLRRHDGAPLAPGTGRSLAGIFLPRGTIAQSVFLGEVGEPVASGFQSYCQRKGTEDEVDNPEGYRLVEGPDGVPELWLEGGAVQQYLALIVDSSGVPAYVPAAVRRGTIRIPGRRPYCDRIFE